MRTTLVVGGWQYPDVSEGMSANAIGSLHILLCLGEGWHDVDFDQLAHDRGIKLGELMRLGYAALGKRKDGSDIMVISNKPLSSGQGWEFLSVNFHEKRPVFSVSDHAYVL